MKRQAVVSVLLLLAVVYLEAARTPCAKRTYSGLPGINSFVCVCNSTYCDTVEGVDTDDKQTTYQEFVTDRSQYRLEKFKNKLEPTGSPKSQLNITINRSFKLQKIIGFGGAVTDSAAYNIYTLSSGTIANLANSYFADSGLEYNIIRVTVGGADFSMREYTYDDFQNDFNLTLFALGPEDVKWKIPFIQASLKASKKNVKLFASAWTAPPWMKTNNDYKGNGTLNGEPGGVYYQTWANYYVKFFQAYKEQGINFWAMTAQNEPTDGDIYKFNFNCMGFTPQTQAIFVAKNLGPTLEANGFGNIKIMILDDQRLFLPGWVQQAFEVSPDVRKYVSGIAVHWYLDAEIPSKILDETHAMFPDKWIFGTEACTGPGPLIPHVILGGFNRAESYAKDIIQDLNHWVTGWTDWNIALDPRGGPNWANNFVDAPIIVNITTDEFYKQPMFYALGHFSKFIPENSTRIDALFKGDSLKGKVSYTTVNDETSRKTVMVMLNKADEDLSYSIYDPDTKQYINSVIGAHSIKTIVWFY